MGGTCGPGSWEDNRTGCSLYENSSVGRASVQWGGRPRPPTDMAAKGRPPITRAITFAESQIAVKGWHRQNLHG